MALAKTAVKIKKPVKSIAATILDKTQRRIYLNAMIDAEIAFMSSKNRKFSDPATSQKSRDIPKD